MNSYIYNSQCSTYINIQIALIIDLFKSQDLANYNMYKINGLTDEQIFKIITSPSIIDLWNLGE